MQKNSFLFELLTEELPPKLLPKLSRALCNKMQDELQKAAFNFDEIIPFATPRRLAFLIKGLAEKQSVQIIERKGPAIKAAFDKNGEPTKAALGFASSCQADFADLERLKTDQGEWLFYRTEKPGLTIDELLPKMIESALKSLPITRAMRWGDRTEEFIRPVHHVVMIYGDRLISGLILGHNSDLKIFGHRFHAPEPFSLKTADDYEALLSEQGFVIPSFEKRRALIETQLKVISLNLSGQVIIDEALLDEVTALVEWPVALLATFPEKYLELPKEVLILSMISHQKSFPLIDKKGLLLPYFVTVSNIDSRDKAIVIKGNEKVMNARLADADFFYHQDLKQKLSAFKAELNQVTFEKQLGTLEDKTERVSLLSRFIASNFTVSGEELARAVDYSRADLMSQVVGEFPELQGVMGEYYAKIEGESSEVAIALREMYEPRHAKDRLPETLLGLILSVSDRIDTLVGIFGINKQPTGDKDPFGLRRAAFAIVRIFIEKKWSLSLRELIEKSIDTYESINKLSLPNANVLSEVMNFLLDRFSSFCLEKDFSRQEIAAVKATQVEDLYGLYRRLKAVRRFSTFKEAESLSAANKRVSNLIAKQEQKAFEFDFKLLKEDAEIALAECIKAIEPEIAEHLKKDHYGDILQTLATLKDPVNRFFDEVMVMAEDPLIRQNRLALLQKLREFFLIVADIALLG